MNAAVGDPLGAAMVDFAAGRAVPLWLRLASGRRLSHELAAYFAPVTAHERALMDLVEGPALDVGCGPARHARLLQARGVKAIGLDRSLLALELARSHGLRHWLHADARSGPLPAVRTVLLLDGNLGLAGTPVGAVRLLHRLAAACGPGGRLLVGGRAPRRGWLRPLVVRDEYRNLVGPWGRWLRASLPVVLDLAAPAGWRLQHAVTVGARYWAALCLDGPCELRRLASAPCRSASARSSRRCCSPRRPAAARAPAGWGSTRRRERCTWRRMDAWSSPTWAQGGATAPSWPWTWPAAGGPCSCGTCRRPATAGRVTPTWPGPAGRRWPPTGPCARRSATPPRATPGSPRWAAATAWWWTSRRSRPGAGCRATPTTSYRTAPKAGTSATERPTTSCTSTVRARSGSSPASQPRRGRARRSRRPGCPDRNGARPGPHPVRRPLRRGTVRRTAGGGRLPAARCRHPAGPGRAHAARAPAAPDRAGAGPRGPGGGGLRRRPGEHGRGELRLIAGVGTGTAAGTRPPQPAGPHRLLASGLDGPTGVARLPDGRWAVAESGHTSLTVLTT